MKVTDSNIDIQFLSGGGEMGELTRAKDWSKTSLGPPVLWPQSLKITLSIVLNSKFPMFLWWGPDLICFYNDAYRPSLGNEGKHPSILGMNAKDAWVEIWDIIKPLIDKVVMKGEAIWFEDLLIPIYRNGKIEDVYWTFSYSPVYENPDKVEGVLVTCTEKTEKIFIRRQLEESDRRLRLIISQAPVSIGIFRGPDYVTEIANSKSLEIWGRSEEAILNRPILEAMPELRSQGFQEVFDDVYTTGKTFSVTELAVQLVRNGTLETAYVNFSIEALYNDRGKIDGMMAVGIEVTDQVLARRKIEANEENLNIVISASRLGTWELNLKTNESTYSRRYLEILGHNDDIKLSHEQLLKYLHPDDVTVREKAFKEAMETGYLHYESRLIWDDKSIHWFEARGRLSYDEENRPLKLMGIIRDITEEKSHQQELEESEQRFRNLIMQSPVPKAILKGKEFVVEVANEVFLKNIWRKKSDDVIGKKILRVFPELEKQKYADLLNRVYATGEKWKETESLITLYGDDGIKSFYVDFEFAPLIEADKSISGITMTVIDVTEKVEARKKIEESENNFRMLSNTLERKVSERTIELKQKNEDLEKMNKELQSFAYISSHDLQEPLRKIQTFSTRLYAKEFDSLSEAGRDQFKRMQFAAERMQTLIDDLLAYSRTNTSERNFEDVDLINIIDEVKDDLKEEIEEKHASIEIGAMCRINVIPFQFRQLIQNLIANSLKFSRPDHAPSIKIESKMEPGATLDLENVLPEKIYCHLIISDNGIGFEQQYHDRIFELFQRLHGREEYPGTGIGLAIVKKIVENHNGVITATGDVNKGATFEIFIPLG